MMAKKKVSSSSLMSRIEPYLYLTPFFLGVIVFTLFPVVNVIMLSFKEGYRYLTGEFKAIGWGNYTYVLGKREFVQALKNTAIYVFTTIPIATCLSVVLAYLLNQKLRCSALFQTAYFLPMVTSVTAVGLAWRFMFNENVGILNFFLSWFGVDKIGWLTDSGYSMLSMVIYGVWNTLPFTIILLLSGLQNINELYYTAARVDGAKNVRIFMRITVPLLAPTIGLTIIVNSISAFKVFNELFPLFKGQPGPAYNLYTVVYYIYEQMSGSAAVKNGMGRASAAAIILFLIIFVFTMLQLLIQRKWKHY